MSSEEQVPWIPGVNSSYHSGVDGLSLPLLAMTAVVFLACAVYALRDAERPRAQVALFLFLQGVSLGVFVSADLILFFVFFDLRSEEHTSELKSRGHLVCALLLHR